MKLLNLKTGFDFYFDFAPFLSGLKSSSTNFSGLSAYSISGLF